MMPLENYDAGDAEHDEHPRRRHLDAGSPLGRRPSPTSGRLPGSAGVNARPAKEARRGSAVVSRRSHARPLSSTELWDGAIATTPATWSPGADLGGWSPPTRPRAESWSPGSWELPPRGPRPSPREPTRRDLRRVDSGQLFDALARVADLAVADDDLAALSPLAPSFAPAPRMPSPPPASSRVTPEGTPPSPLSTAAAAFPPLVLSPVHPAVTARRQPAPDGRLGGTVVHLSRRAAAASWYGFVRPDEPMLRQQGLCRGDLFLHPSDAMPDWRPEVGDRVSFLLGVHNGRLKAVSVRLDESSDDESDASSLPPVQ